MQTEIFNLINISITIVFVCSVAYLLFAIFALEFLNLKRKHGITGKRDYAPPVTILKPIYGLDPELEENLRSFCRQDYPDYQVIFGLQDKNDAAIPIVEKIINEMNGMDVSYVINPELHGTNHKISNLINIYPKAKHDYLLIADSDMRVPADYLTSVMTPFADRNTGAVTCLYSGSAKGKMVSSLNAMFINEWFLPSVLISNFLQPVKYCLGATMIVRRDILEKIGGLKALSNYLADDYMLGKLITGLGYKIFLSRFIVENVVEETSVKNLYTHELRWARTLKRVEPIGYMLTFLTDTFVMSLLMAFALYNMTDNLLWSVLPVLSVFTGRTVLHTRAAMITGSKNAGSIWMIPLRDILSFCIRMVSFTGNSIQWRNNSFCVDAAGVIHTEQKQRTDLEHADLPPQPGNYTKLLNSES